MRLLILRLPTIKIAFFFVMPKQFLLILCLYQHFFCGISILLRQLVVVGIGSRILFSLVNIIILRFERTHLRAGSQ